MNKPGTCFICHCTERRACPSGCAWANLAKTLCTNCAVTPEILQGRFKMVLGGGPKKLPTLKELRVWSAEDRAAAGRILWRMYLVASDNVVRWQAPPVPAVMRRYL